MMDEMLKKLAAKKSDKMSDQEAQAKLEVIKELLDMAQSAMADQTKSGLDEMMAPKEDMSSVKVSAPDEESLAEGLDMAKDIVEGEEPEMMEESEMPESEDKEDSEEDEEEEKSHFPGLL